MLELAVMMPEAQVDLVMPVLLVEPGSEEVVIPVAMEETLALQVEPELPAPEQPVGLVRPEELPGPVALLATAASLDPVAQLVALAVLLVPAATLGLGEPAVLPSCVRSTL